MFLGECWPCPAGQTCQYTGLNVTSPCPSGHYCPNGTFDDGMPCPLGKFSISRLFIAVLVAFYFRAQIFYFT